jgi:hypothetical protein
MIDPSIENLVPLSKACRLINPSRPVHNATIWRWVKRGVARVKLEAIRIGGVHFTSHEAIARFLNNLNRHAPNAVPLPPNRQAEWAMDRLTAIGC